MVKPVADALSNSSAWTESDILFLLMPKTKGPVNRGTETTPTTQDDLSSPHVDKTSLHPISSRCKLSGTLMTADTKPKSPSIGTAFPTRARSRPSSTTTMSHDTSGDNNPTEPIQSTDIHNAADCFYIPSTRQVNTRPRTPGLGDWTKAIVDEEHLNDGFDKFGPDDPFGKDDDDCESEPTSFMQQCMLKDNRKFHMTEEKWYAPRPETKNTACQRKPALPFGSPSTGRNAPSWDHVGRPLSPRFILNRTGFPDVLSKKVSPEISSSPTYQKWREMYVRWRAERLLLALWD